MSLSTLFGTMLQRHVAVYVFFFVMCLSVGDYMEVHFRTSETFELNVHDIPPTDVLTVDITDLNDCLKRCGRNTLCTGGQFQAHFKTCRILANRTRMSINEDLRLRAGVNQVSFLKLDSNDTKICENKSFNETLFDVNEYFRLV
ncbi:hypothetical protein QR680_006543 [Steinernema hermaphroditum]|uniref:Apple domain-containing protein n=1 Tax=Steinernema hermaphroditum TaxID=289476 RepID=A0AA39HVX3_9BILA|nr:hypothetical protein QR680_006543 [Steinernema hermaphroditum]